MRFAMIVLAMKEIGEKNMTDDAIAQIVSLVRQEHPEDYKQDILIAPQWIRRILNKAIA